MRSPVLHPDAQPRVGYAKFTDYLGRYFSLSAVGMDALRLWWYRTRCGQTGGDGELFVQRQTLVRMDLSQTVCFVSLESCLYKSMDPLNESMLKNCNVSKLLHEP